MNKTLILVPLMALLGLSACTTPVEQTPGSNQVGTSTAPSSERIVEKNGSMTKIDCNNTPESKSDIALWREYCL